MLEANRKNLAVIVTFCSLLSPAFAMNYSEVIEGIESARANLLNRDLVLQYRHLTNYRTGITRTETTETKKDGVKTHRVIVRSSTQPEIISDTYIRATTYEYVRWADGRKYVSMVNDHPTGKSRSQFEIDDNLYKQTSFPIDPDLSQPNHRALFVKEASKAPSFRNPIKPVMTVGYLNLTESDISQLSAEGPSEEIKTILMTFKKGSAEYSVDLFHSPVGIFPLRVRITHVNGSFLYESHLSGYRDWGSGLWMPEVIEEEYPDNGEVGRKHRYEILDVSPVSESQESEFEIQIEKPYTVVDNVQGRRTRVD